MLIERIKAALHLFPIHSFAAYLLSDFSVPGIMDITVIRT